MSQPRESGYEGSAGQSRGFRNPGGTSGGLGTFLFGLLLSVIGGYLLMNQVQVTSGYWLWWGSYTFGFTLVPLLLGIAVLFYDGKSPLGWLLAVGGLFIVFAGILANLHLYLRQTSLFDFLLIATLFVGGFGLMARSLKSQ